MKSYSGSEVFIDQTPEEKTRRYLTTAAFHDKMARVFRSVKREADAKAAEEAAKKCRVIAGVFLADEAPKVAA